MFTSWWSSTVWGSFWCADSCIELSRSSGSSSRRRNCHIWGGGRGWGWPMILTTIPTIFAKKIRTVKGCVKFEIDLDFPVYTWHKCLKINSLKSKLHHDSKPKRYYRKLRITYFMLLFMFGAPLADDNAFIMFILSATEASLASCSPQSPTESRGVRSPWGPCCELPRVRDSLMRFKVSDEVMRSASSIWSRLFVSISSCSCNFRLYLFSFLKRRRYIWLLFFSSSISPFSSVLSPPKFQNKV